MAVPTGAAFFIGRLMPSRDPRDLHAELKRRWEWLVQQWAVKHPQGPQPFLTCTYRPRAEQSELVRAGRSKAGPGQSLHNFIPALAFDVAFKHSNGEVTWDFHWFEKWGELAEQAGLEWGGRWPQLVDGPHVQWPVTWQEAAAGNLPELPPLPDPNPLLPVSSLYLKSASGRTVSFLLDPERPARVVGRKLYANVLPSADGEPL